MNIFDVAHMLEDAIKGVRYLHSHKFVHSSIKPENILVRSLNRDGVSPPYKTVLALKLVI